MCVFPVTADSVTDYTQAPSMEYAVYIAEPGRYDVTLYTSPTLNFVPGRGLRIAVGMDDAKPVVIDAYAGRVNWDALVKDNCRQMRAQLDVATAGIHTFKIYMVDPAVVVEKIVLSSGRLPQTYFGPKFSTPVKTK